MAGHVQPGLFLGLKGKESICRKEAQGKLSALRSRRPVAARRRDIGQTLCTVAAAVKESPVAIVTAASRGIGAACARELARRGYRLALMSRSAAIEDVGREAGAVVVLRGSICIAEDLRRLVDQTVEACGRIDAVVNNSGHPAGGELLAIPDGQWSEVFESYVLSVIRMARLVVPIMQK